jgi:hypothetical protein
MHHQARGSTRASSGVKRRVDDPQERFQEGGCNAWGRLPDHSLDRDGRRRAVQLGVSRRW